MTAIYCNPDDVREHFIGTVLADAGIDDTVITPRIERAQDKIKRLLTGFSPDVKSAWTSRALTPEGVRRVTSVLGAAYVVRDVKGGNAEWAKELEDEAIATIGRLNYGSEELYDVGGNLLIPSKGTVRAARDSSDREITRETLEDF